MDDPSPHLPGITRGFLGVSNKTIKKVVKTRQGAEH